MSITRLTQATIYGMNHNNPVLLQHLISCVNICKQDWHWHELSPIRVFLALIIIIIIIIITMPHPETNNINNTSHRRRTPQRGCTGGPRSRLQAMRLPPFPVKCYKEWLWQVHSVVCLLRCFCLSLFLSLVSSFLFFASLFVCLFVCLFGLGWVGLGWVWFGLVCLFASLLVCLLVCLFVCLFSAVLALVFLRRCEAIELKRSWHNIINNQPTNETPHS